MSETSDFEFSPMLGVASDQIDKMIKDAKRVLQMKEDGTRAAVYIDQDGDVHLLGRGKWRGQPRDYAPNFPELVDALGRAGIPEGSILDAEIVCIDDEGRSDFSRVQKRMSRIHDVHRVASEVPATVRFFDVMSIASEDFTKKPYIERHEELLGISDAYHLNNKFLEVLELAVSEDEKRDLWEKACESGEEGVMAKIIDAQYRFGSRSPQWTKVKRKVAHDVFILGWKKGTGKRNMVLDSATGEYIETFGALNAYQMVPSPIDGKMEPKFVCNVGGGFNDQELVNITKKHLLPDGNVRDPFVIEIYTFGSSKRVGGKGRMPQFNRHRTDKPTEECVYDF